MKIVNVRRVGNSNVVSIPAEMQRLGYTSGTAVVIDEMPNGDLRIAPAARVREAPGEGTADHGGERERPDDDADGHVARADRPVDVAGQHREHGADRKERAQRRGEHARGRREKWMARPELADAL